MFAYRAEPVLFERVLLLSDECRDKFAHAFHHDYEIITAGIHILYVEPAEVAPVKDEAHLLVSIGLHFLQHVLQLGDIDYGTRIFLIEKGLPIVDVIGNSIVEDPYTIVVLWLSIFQHLDITCLAVLVGGVVGNVDFLPVVALLVPLVEKLHALVGRNGLEKIGNLGVTVHLHCLGEQRVVVSKVRIVLPCVVLTDDGVDCKIQEETAVGSDYLFNHRINAIGCDDLLDDEERTDLETGASQGQALFPGKVNIGEVLEEVLVRPHPRIIGLR